MPTTIRTILAARAKYEEVQSDLFRGSGVNASTEDAKIAKFAQAMRKNGWGRFPPIHGHVSRINQADWEKWEEAEEGGYTHELDYSRPLTRADIGKTIAYIEDGHNRAYAARAAGIPLRIKVW